MLAPSHILHISHPNVTSAYIKQDLEAHMNGKQVLVLETNINVSRADETEEDKYFDLLAALKSIRNQAEKQFGDISRVDIRGATVH